MLALSKWNEKEKENQKSVFGRSSSYSIVSMERKDKTTEVVVDTSGERLDRPITRRS